MVPFAHEPKTFIQPSEEASRLLDRRFAEIISVIALLHAVSPEDEKKALKRRGLTSWERNRKGAERKEINTSWMTKISVRLQIKSRD